MARKKDSTISIIIYLEHIKKNYFLQRFEELAPNYRPALMKIHLTSFQLSLQTARDSLTFLHSRRISLKYLLLPAKPMENGIVSEGKIKMGVISGVS